MTHENENAANLHTGLKRREFMAMLAGCTAGLMVPSLSHGEGKIAAATASHSDRLGKLLPLRKLGSSGAVVTNLGVGGDHVGSASEKDAQAIIEKALEEGVRFFDNAPLYSDGKAEERYGKFLTPKYRDVSFIMTKDFGHKQEGCPEGSRRFPLPHEDRLRGPMAGACPPEPEGRGRARPKRCARCISRGQESGQGQAHRLHRPSVPTKPTSRCSRRSQSEV